MFRNLTSRLLLSVVIIVLCGSSVWADFEAGTTAWNAGRTTEALTQWQAAARGGDARAMLALGRAYVKGLGVPQDYIEAHKWLNLAAGQGNVEAAAEREALAAKMTPQQIALAQEHARSWRSGATVDTPKPADDSPTAAASPVAGPPPPHAIREAQALMAALGYKPGPADGRWGARTGRAYAAFLRDAGLPPGDVLTPDALRAMRAVAKRRNVAPPPPTQRKPSPPPVDLHRLVASGDIDRLKAALEGGADANARDGTGWTPLMRAADKGHALLVPMLLKAGADANLRAPDGATALFMATLGGHAEIIAALMKAGADHSIKGPQGKTAVDVARLKFGNYFHARERGVDQAVLELLKVGGIPTEDAVEVINQLYTKCGMFTFPDAHETERHTKQSAERVDADTIKFVWQYYGEDRRISYNKSGRLKRLEATVDLRLNLLRVKMHPAAEKKRPGVILTPNYGFPYKNVGRGKDGTLKRIFLRTCDDDMARELAQILGEYAQL